MKVSEAIVPVTAALTSINEAYTTMFESLQNDQAEEGATERAQEFESCDQLS